MQLAYDIAASKGFTIPFDNVAMFGSHTHSGPGAITPEFIWEVAPATDLLVPGENNTTYCNITHFIVLTELQEMLAESIATAMLEAAANLQDGSIGIGMHTTCIHK